MKSTYVITFHFWNSLFLTSCTGPHFFHLFEAGSSVCLIVKKEEARFLQEGKFQLHSGAAATAAVPSSASMISVSGGQSLLLCVVRLSLCLFA